MYDDADDREEALAQARSERARSTQSSPSSSGLGSQSNDGGMTRAVSLDTGLSENNAKPPSVVWKTAYESADSKEELGRQLDEQAAEAAAKEDQAESDSDNEDEDEDTPTGSSLFEAQADGGEEPETPRNSVFRFWNDESSDEEEATPTGNLHPLFQRMGDEDSDDEISEGDIEPDITSPPTTDACDSSSEEEVDDETSEGEEREEDEESDQDREDEEEEEDREDDDGPDIMRSDHLEAVPEVQAIERAETAPTPASYVRPTAKSFLSMFFNPAVLSAATNDLEEEIKAVVPFAAQRSGEPVTVGTLLGGQILGDQTETDQEQADHGTEDQNQDHDASIEPDDEAEKDARTNQAKNNEIYNDKTDRTNRNGNNDSDDDVGPELQLDETQPDWDINLSLAYKIKCPNGNYIVRFTEPSLDWDVDYLPDEWTVGTDWYQGGPEPDPRDVRWRCPLTQNLRDGEQHRRVIKFTEPTEYYSESEAVVGTFYDGRRDMASHAEYLMKEMQGIENWRRNEYRKDLMINWRVRTGQQTPICGGWWFIDEGYPWWRLDWSSKARWYHDD